MLRATTACNFSSLIWPAGSAPAALASLLFDPPEPQIIGKTQCFATFLPFLHLRLLSSYSFSSTLLSSNLSLLSASALLCFSSVHTVGSLTSKLPSTKHTILGPLLEVAMSKKCTPLWRGAKHISKSKCTKHTRSGPLLAVEMSKKCTQLWREARFEVKMLKTPGVRTTFGGSDVDSLRFTTLQLHYAPQHYNCTTTQLHSTTLHYTPLHYITLHYVPLHFTTLHYTTFHYTSLHYTTLHSTTLQLHLRLHNYTPPHEITLHYNTTLHYITLNDTAPQIDR